MRGKLIDSEKFFSAFRAHYGKLTQRQVSALNFFNKKVIEFQETFSLQEWAYIYATVVHETGYTFECVREAPKKAELWRKNNLRYYPYYGRGYVQITWTRNYELFGKLLNIDLLNNPDLALQPEIAFQILVRGCKEGLFTGRKLGHYLGLHGKFDAINARRVINSTDKAQQIAKHYDQFLEILTASLYDLP